MVQAVHSSIAKRDTPESEERQCIFLCLFLLCGFHFILHTRFLFLFHNITLVKTLCKPEKMKLT